jgi:hypothetical protein
LHVRDLAEVIAQLRRRVWRHGTLGAQRAALLRKKNGPLEPLKFAHDPIGPAIRSDRGIRRHRRAAPAGG